MDAPNSGPDFLESDSFPGQGLGHEPYRAVPTHLPVGLDLPRLPGARIAQRMTPPGDIRLFTPAKVALLAPANRKNFMTLSQSLEQVKRCAKNMDARYGKTVFDEWAVVSFQSGKERIVAYQGPRKEHFQKNFVDDLGILRADLLTTKHQAGHFDFARHAVGTRFEAYVCVGEELYLLCNNTQSSMNEITKDGRWLDAQKAFAELTDRFRDDPLTV